MSKTRAGLLRHIRGHANSGNYNCCGKAFQDAYNLRKFQRTKDPNVTCVYSAAGALRTNENGTFRLTRKLQFAMPALGLNPQIDFDGSINELPGNVFIKIRELLDRNPADKDWRALIRCVESNPKYKISNVSVEQWSPAISHESPGGKLLTELGSRGMRVGELRENLEKINIDTFQLGLSPYEAIRLITSPSTSKDLYDGDTLELVIEATGRPHPRYQWFFCENGKNDFKKLQGYNQAILRIQHITQQNAGGYSCQIHNCGDPNKTVLTKLTVVSVSPNPRVANGLHPPDSGDFIYMFSQLSAVDPDHVAALVNGLQDRSADYGSALESITQIQYKLITGHPQDITVTLGQSFKLSVKTSGDPPIHYQWYRNGVKLEDGQGPTYNVICADKEDMGSYYCIVNNGVKKEQCRTAQVKETIKTLEADITIISHPQSVDLSFGGSALFSVEAQCHLPLSYQWFKDGAPITGETGSDLKIVNIQEQVKQGLYQCEVSLATPVAGIERKRKLSKSAFLRLKIPAVTDNIMYNPSDKVALLIGNSDYKSEIKLAAPKSDVHDLAEQLASMDFRVVTLLNLTKPEIENAVMEFSRLIGPNVYVLFYFCGHGFEENGISFLVPTDAPSMYSAEECVNAFSVLDNFQRKQPALICMIIDICRRAGKVKSNAHPSLFDQKVSKGNTIYCYATSPGLAAFEDKNHGLLLYHLKPLICKPVGIEKLFSEIKEEFFKVPKHSTRQLPELRSNLSEPNRSLTDRIAKKGNTQSYDLQTQIWNSYHVKPPKASGQLP
ncbi:hypothetical protein DPMN_102921 [Dreissena polymorpha]|uniref:Mucosa-associated lymphoid tissue lymphoma translocation protein 1 n=2 Tax=Dreissena polymorpha TaxID=45954 RepID=A0A9D4H927_DREPO|nr:hypothetical protein DPMN_102921 [Dreissena polymorpha]